MVQLSVVAHSSASSHGVQQCCTVTVAAACRTRQVGPPRPRQRRRGEKMPEISSGWRLAQMARTFVVPLCSLGPELCISLPRPAIAGKPARSVAVEARTATFVSGFHHCVPVRRVGRRASPFLWHGTPSCSNSCCAPATVVAGSAGQRQEATGQRRGGPCTMRSAAQSWRNRAPCDF